MGVLWWIYCLKHKENLDVYKYWHGPRKVGPVPPNLLEIVRHSLKEEEPDPGPDEVKLNRRYVSLISAFLDRHMGCELNICNDENNKCNQLSKQRGEGWMAFCIHDDILLMEYMSLPDVYGRKRDVDRCRAKIENIEKELANPKTGRRKRRRLRKGLEGWRETLSSRMESLRKSEEWDPGDRSKDEARHQEALEEARKDVEESEAEVRLLEEQLKRPDIKRRERRKLEEKLDASRSVLDTLKEVEKSVASTGSIDLLAVLRTEPLGREA